MEHRGTDRKHLFLYLEVIDRQSKSLLGHLGDISDGGMMIITDQDLPLNQIKYVRVKLPEDEFNLKYLDAKVETRWVKPDVNPELSCVGCRFLHVEKEGYDIIEKLVILLTFEG